MEKSVSITEIGKALAAFQKKMNPIKKDSKNPFFKSSYASLFTILEHIQVPLSECGLSFAQFPSGENGLTTILMHESGEYLQAEYTMRPSKDDPQGRGSAITYQRRYALGAILGLNIDEDDDANEASQTPANKSENGKEKPWLNKWDSVKKTTTTKEWDNTIKKLSDGTITIDTVRGAYKLSKELEAELKKIEPSPESFQEHHQSTKD